MGPTLMALRCGREAIARLESQLGELLTSLRSPGGMLNRSDADRLVDAKDDAIRAMQNLQTFGQQLFG